MDGNVEFDNPQKEKLKPENQALEVQKTRVIESREQKQYPQMSVNIFYSPHGTAKDAEGFREEFKKADVYIPERRGWTESGLRRLRMISRGEISQIPILGKDFKEPNDFYWGTYNIIYKSNKPITLIDIPENHPLVERIDENKAEEGIRFGSDFSDVLDYERRNLIEQAAITKEREQYMIEQLEPRVQELLKDYPDLQNKQQINILLTLGSLHTFFYHNLKKDYSTTRVMSKTYRVFDFYLEAKRRLMLGKPVDDGFLARANMNQCLFMLWELYPNRLLQLISDSYKIEVSRKLCVLFSFDEIRDMFEGAEDIDSWNSLFEEELSRKGFKMPQSEKELDGFLAKGLAH